MKKLLILLMCILGILCASAQDNNSTYLSNGYRGFGESGLRPLISEPNFSSVAITTIHGYQSRWAFLGGGFSVQPFISIDDEEDCSFTETAVFLDSRIDFPNKISPIVDTRLGFTVGHYLGFYVAQAFGVRFLRFSLSVGYENEWFTAFELDGSSYDSKERITMESIMLNFTVDWGARNK